MALEKYGCKNPLIFIDENVSGLTLERPGLERLRDAVKAGLIDIAIAYSPDRWSRDMMHSLMLEEEFKRRRGVKIDFVNGGSEDSPEGEYSRNVLRAGAQYEAAKFKERSRRGRRERAIAGGVHSGGVLFGYKYLGKLQGQCGKLEIIPVQAAIVRRIFNLAISGMSHYAIALLLNREGIPTQKNMQWHRGTVSQLLDKTAYFGKAPGPDGMLIDVPAIMTKAEFDAAHAAQRRNAIAKVGRPSNRYLLRSLIWCKKCGRRVTSITGHAYRCSNIDNITHKRQCSAPQIKAKRLDDSFWNLLCDTITDPRVLWQHVQAFHQQQAKPAISSAAETRFKRAQQAVQHAERVYRDPRNLIPFETRQSDLMKAQAELIAAEHGMGAANIAVMPQRSTVEQMARDCADIRKLTDFEDRRDMAERVVERMLWEGEEYEIHCRLNLAKSAAAGGENRRCHLTANVNSDATVSFVIRGRAA
jgi:site-specific DNA recombinase